MCQAAGVHNFDSFCCAALKRVINVPSRKLGAASLAGLDAWAAARGQTLAAAIFHGCQVLYLHFAAPYVFAAIC